MVNKHDLATIGAVASIGALLYGYAQNNTTIAAAGLVGSVALGHLVASHRFGGFGDWY